VGKYFNFFLQGIKGNLLREVLSNCTSKISRFPAVGLHNCLCGSNYSFRAANLSIKSEPNIA
jgi:hypothetical protein